MKKKLLNVIAAIDARLKKNSLSEDAAALWEEVRAAFEALAEDEAEHTITELKDRFEEIAAKYDAQDQEVAERIQKLRNEVMGMFNAGSKSVKDKMTADVRNAIMAAYGNSRDAREMESKVMEIAKQNDITGFTAPQLVDYALQLKQEDNDELYAEFEQVPYNRFYVSELDADNAANTAKQWNGLGVEVTEKEIQTMVLEGITIDTKEIYKRQRVANAALDDVEEAGRLTEFGASINKELRRGVQGLQVRAALIGDAVNPSGSRVTSFETLGTKNASDIFTKVIAPAGSTPDLLDLRKASMAVKFDYKIAIITSETKLALINRKYSASATPILLSDEELAAQIGVNKVYTRDFIANVEGLHAIIVNPREYWIYTKKEREVAYPQYDKNCTNWQFEQNAGGHSHAPESSAIVKSASAGSSSK